MNLRTLFVFVAFLVLLSACKPAETPTADSSVEPVVQPAQVVTAGEPVDLIETEGLLQRISTLASDELDRKSVV